MPDCWVMVVAVFAVGLLAALLGAWMLRAAAGSWRQPQTFGWRVTVVGKGLGGLMLLVLGVTLMIGSMLGD